MILQKFLLSVCLQVTFAHIRRRSRGYCSKNIFCLPSWALHPALRSLHWEAFLWWWYSLCLLKWCLINLVRLCLWWLSHSSFLFCLSRRMPRAALMTTLFWPAYMNIWWRKLCWSQLACVYQCVVLTFPDHLLLLLFMSAFSDLSPDADIPAHFRCLVLWLHCMCEGCSWR